MEFPSEVRRLIRRFAREPTPSAKAFRAAFQGKDVVEAKAPMSCCECQTPLPRCFRKWTFAENGRVIMYFKANSGLCPCCIVDVCSPYDTRLLPSEMCVWL